jgi:hypothetical protein
MMLSDSVMSRHNRLLLVTPAITCGLHSFLECRPAVLGWRLTK